MVSWFSLSYTNTVRQERNTLKEQLKESQSQLSSLKAENKKLASSGEHTNPHPFNQILYRSFHQN